MKRKYINESFDKNEGYYHHYNFFTSQHADHNRKRIKEYLQSEHGIKIYYGDPTNEEIAKALGITAVNLSRILNGKVKLSVDMIIKLAWLCDVTTYDIIKLERDLGLLDEIDQKYIDHLISKEFQVHEKVEASDDKN